MASVSGPDVQSGRRHLPLEGGCNFRDLGGYESEDGRHVRWGRLYRSGTIGELTDRDWMTLCRLGIRVFCDLRTTGERQSAPFRWASHDGHAYYSRDYETSFAKLRELMQQAFATEADAMAAMIDGYRRLPFDQAPSYRTIFEHLLSGDTPLLVNCSAGKDRAGLAAALLLGALGVSRNDIIADYELTNIYGDLEKRLGKSGNGSLGTQSPEIQHAILSARSDYLLAAFDAIDDRHGSIYAYLDAELGVDDSAIEKLRSDLLE